MLFLASLLVTQLFTLLDKQRTRCDMTNKYLHLVNAVQAMERVLHHTASLPSVDDRDIYYEAIKLYYKLRQLKREEEDK